MSQLKFEFSESSKIVKCISIDSNPSQITDFLNLLNEFRLEVNNYLTNRISSNGVPDSTDDDDSGSDEEIVEAVHPKKRKKANK